MKLILQPRVPPTTDLPEWLWSPQGPRVIASAPSEESSNSLEVTQISGQRTTEFSLNRNDPTTSVVNPNYENLSDATISSINPAGEQTVTHNENDYDGDDGPIFDG